jgi:hypothetical protein
MLLQYLCIVVIITLLPSLLLAACQPGQTVKSNQYLTSVISRVVELLNFYGLLNSKPYLDFFVLYINVHKLL